MQNADTTEIDKAYDFKPEEEGRIIENSKHIEIIFLSIISFLFLKNQQLNPLSKAQILLKLARLLILKLRKVKPIKKIKLVKIV